MTKGNERDTNEDLCNHDDDLLGVRAAGHWVLYCARCERARLAVDSGSGACSA